MVFQGPSLLPSLDVTENVALPLLFAGQASPRGHAATHSAALDLVGIGDLAAKLPEELSGGQAQRVAIARVLAARPAADPRRRTHRADRPPPPPSEVITVLLDAAISIGAAVIIATHDPAVAARLPDHWVDARRTAATPNPPPIDSRAT